MINTIRHYDIIGVMTAGGPAGATEVLPVLLYNTAFRGNRFGEAAAHRRPAARHRARVLVFYVRLTRPIAGGARMKRAALRPRRCGGSSTLAALAVDAVPVLLDAQHVAQARDGDLPCRRRRSCPRTGRSTRTRRCSRSGRCGRYFVEQPDRVALGTTVLSRRARSARRLRVHALLPRRRDAVRDVPALHQDAAGDAADHSLLPADVGPRPPQHLSSR